MDGEFDERQTAGANVASLIRARHSGYVSDEPTGVAYPGVPNVQEVLDTLGLERDQPMTEAPWIRACEILGVGDEPADEAD